MTFGIDFDGTCVTHEFPDRGQPVPGAIEVLRELAAAGHDLVLFTMRCDGGRHGDMLAAAVDWFRENEIPLLGANHNPTQLCWTASPKVYAQCYIDDAALGCPLVHPANGRRPYVDWEKVREQLVTMRALESC